MTATAPQLDLCPACGQRSDSDVGCTRCGASLRVDLWLDGPIPDDRTRFLAARGLASLALPGGTFSELKRALAHPDGPLAVALPRSAARAAIDALGRHGIGASARSCAPQPRRALSRTRIAAASGTAALLLVAGGGRWFWRDQHASSPSSSAVQVRATPNATGPVQPAPAAPPVKASGSLVTPQAPLTTQEVTSLAIGSVAEVSCGGSLGTAFFVAPEHAATNAHVVCGKDVPLRVRLKDGRELIGKTVTLEKRLDLAVIEVPGAAATPIELGDSTALVPGDALVLVGNPHGLAFTVHEGKVSYVGRNVLGNAYVQMNANVNPGNSGGPLLDGRGHVVGIVSMKVTGADAIGLALPIEYLRPFLARLEAAAPDAQARWQAMLDRVRQEDAAEVEKYRGKYQKPAIAAVGVGGRGLYGVVLRRWPDGPSRLSITVDVLANERTLCSTDATVGDWEKVEQTLEKALRDSPDQPRLAWASENHILRDVFAGTALLDLGRCELADVPASAVLVIRGGEEADSPIRFPKPSVVETSSRIADAEDRARRTAEEQQAARDEAAWRKAFRRLRAEIASLEAKRNQLKASAVNSLPTSDSSDPGRQLSDIEARLAKARESLDDLERQASSAAVPRPWRE